MMPYSPVEMTQGPKTRMDSHEKDRLYQKGLEAFNSAHFYDAHEHWEEVWLETPNPDKMFLQGLIQVAAAFHHYSRANLPGTRNLLLAGLLKLDCFPEVHGGLEIEALREAVRGWLAALEAGEIPESRKPPRIGRHDARPPCH
jgi:predicted metal-dependent hydrolase